MCIARALHVYGTHVRHGVPPIVGLVLPPFERFQDMLEFARGKDDTAPACEQRSVA